MEVILDFLRTDAFLIGLVIFVLILFILYIVSISKLSKLRKSYKQFFNTVLFYCDILREMKIIVSKKDEWAGNPQKKFTQLINYGKRMITPESVSEFLRLQKNELLGGDE